MMCHIKWFVVISVYHPLPRAILIVPPTGILAQSCCPDQQREAGEKGAELGVRLFDNRGQREVRRHTLVHSALGRHHENGVPEEKRCPLCSTDGTHEVQAIFDVVAAGGDVTFGSVVKVDMSSCI